MIYMFYDFTSAVQFGQKIIVGNVVKGWQCEKTDLTLYV